MGILGNLQHLFIALMTAVITAIMVVLPINKLSSSSVLTPLAKNQQVKGTSPDNVLGTEQENRKEKNQKSAQTEIVQTPTATPTPTLTPIPTVTPTLMLNTPTTIPVPASSVVQPPTTPPQQVQAPQVNIETLCKGYADELRATFRHKLGSSIYDSNPYYELTSAKFYNYCLANNGNTSGFKVEPP